MSDKIFGERFFSMVYDVVDTTEVVDGFQNIINVDSIIGEADGVINFPIPARK